jgi:cytoskeleton protein RodZ
VREGWTSGLGGNAVQNGAAPAGNPAGNTAAGSGSDNTAGNAANGTGGETAGQPGLRVVGQTFSNHQQTYVVSTTGPMVAQLTASTGACWVRATVDGQVVDPSDTIPVGQSRTWQGSQQIRIRVGFVPGVTLTLNGQPLALPDTKDAIDVVIVRGQD